MAVARLGFQRHRLAREIPLAAAARKCKRSRRPAQPAGRSMCRPRTASATH